jgi:hypothetical protein
MSPLIESSPGSALPEVWVYLSRTEAAGLLEALRVWAGEGADDPDWHHHIGGAGSEVTVAVADLGEP